MSLVLFLLEVCKLLIVLISPLCQLSLGNIIVEKLCVVLGLPREEVFQGNVRLGAACFMIGLLAHMLAVFFLKCIGAPWILAFGLPLAPLLFVYLHRRRIPLDLRIPANANYAIWFFVIVALGLSLFDSLEGIRTPWKNNYGDFTFHTGMISSWVLGDNFPPQYHIFPGVGLSYPVLMNIWTASLWWMNTSFYQFSLLFIFQWTILWTVVFYALRGEKYWFLPWAVLLGGGSYFALGENSGELIGKEAPWACFLTTIWVTQRTALLGMASLLTSLWAFHKALGEHESAPKRRFYIALSCLILALSPLAHTHITLVGVLYVACVLLFRFFALAFHETLKVPGKQADWSGAKRAFGEGLFAITFLIPGIHALPWLLGKSGMTKIIPGWFTIPAPEGASVWQQMLISVEMWYQNAGVWGICFLLLWALTRKHLFFISMLVIFLFGNVVQLAEWNWDQIKIFIALYAVMLSVWSQFKRSDAWLAHFLVIFLMIPALYESYEVFHEGPNYTIYTPEEVERAKQIELRTDKDAIIAGAPRHNSLVTLTGRKLFYGYEGTLSSHRLPYLPRREMMQSLSKIARCREVRPAEECPTHLLWTQEEEKYWKKKRPIQMYEKTTMPYLFSIPEPK